MVGLRGVVLEHGLGRLQISASVLFDLQRFEEAKSLLRKIIPMARRGLGEGQHLTLRMRLNYAEALYEDPEATLFEEGGSDDRHSANFPSFLFFLHFPVGLGSRVGGRPRAGFLV